MDYNNGSQYGYDVIHTSPLMDSFDSPYLQVPSKMRDPQYGAVGTTKQSFAPPAKKPYFPPRDNYRPAKPQKVVIVQLAFWVELLFLDELLQLVETRLLRLSQIPHLASGVDSASFSTRWFVSTSK